MNRSRSTEQSYNYERRRPNGTVLDVRNNRLPGGGWVRTFTDITKRKRAEEALREKTEFLQLNQIITAAANEATKVEDTMQTALDQVCAHTGWPVGHVWMLADDGSGELVPTRIWHLDDAPRFETFRRVTEGDSVARSFAGLIGRVLASGKPAWITP